MKLITTAALFGIVAAHIASACHCDRNSDPGRWIDNSTPGGVVAMLTEIGGGEIRADKQGRLVVTLSDPEDLELRKCLAYYALDEQRVRRRHWYLWTRIECWANNGTATAFMTRG